MSWTRRFACGAAIVCAFAAPSVAAPAVTADSPAPDTTPVSSEDATLDADVPPASDPSGQSVTITIPALTPPKIARNATPKPARKPVEASSSAGVSAKPPRAASRRTTPPVRRARVATRLRVRPKHPARHRSRGGASVRIVSRHRPRGGASVQIVQVEQITPIIVPRSRNASPPTPRLPTAAELQPNGGLGEKSRWAVGIVAALAVFELIFIAFAGYRRWTEKRLRTL